jgi:hypothetical protein
MAGGVRVMMVLDSVRRGRGGRGGRLAKCGYVGRWILFEKGQCSSTSAS